MHSTIHEREEVVEMQKGNCKMHRYIYMSLLKIHYSQYSQYSQ